jgi:hypothetical protein
MDDSIKTATGDDALRQVQKQAAEMAAVDNQAERGYAHLGWLLLEVAEMGYWRVRYNTFRDYLRLVAAHAKRTVGQLQQYYLTVRDLSDTFSAAQLETMGITKAIRLRAAKDYAIVLPASVVNAALDPKVTVKELKQIISTALKMPEEEGDWMDLEFEFMVTPEQRALFTQAIDVAMHTEPLTKKTISKSAQMLDVMTKLAQEFLGAHSGDGQ